MTYPQVLVRYVINVNEVHDERFRSSTCGLRPYMGSRFMGYHLRDKDLDSPLGYSYVLSILPTSILIKLVVLMIAFCILLVFIRHVLLLEFLDFLHWRNLETLKSCTSRVKLQIKSRIACRVSKT